MKKRYIISFSIIAGLLLISGLGVWSLYNRFFKSEPVLKDPPKGDKKIIFLHHSTGQRIWDGGVKEWFNKNQPTLSVTEQAFPKKTPYGWNNYPYDYWNIWVNHAGTKSYKNEPTLEMITDQYDLVILKHCYPVSNILSDDGNPDITSSKKTLANYKLQYNALKEKFHQFPDTKFLVWTGAALLESDTTPENAQRMKEFVEWVKSEWDQPNDNIFIWDFYNLETEGSLYLLPKNGGSDSHPNDEFSKRVASLLCERIVEII